MSATPRIDAAALRRLAVAASCDPRTVARELREPGSVKGLPGDRIRAALALATSPAFTDHVPPAPAASTGGSLR